MSKKWKVIIWIVIVLAVLSIVVLKAFGVNTVWSVISWIIACVAGVMRIASFIADSKDNSKDDPKGSSEHHKKTPPISYPPPSPLKPSDKTVFDIIKIDRAHDIITVNFKSKDKVYPIKKIIAKVNDDDICTLHNPQDFPINSLDSLGQFYVKLKLQTISSNDTISDITIECSPYNGFWSEDRHIEVNDLVEVEYKEKK